MKNRLLPFCLITAITGISMFLSVLSMAGQPGTPDHRNYAGSWLEKVRANQITGKVNPMDVMKAQQQAEALRTKSAAGAMSLNWHSAGPDNYTGRVWSVIYDNTDQTGNNLISGALCGGIWKSADLGLTWQQMPVENNIVPSVSSLVQTSDGKIYAATGIFAAHEILYPGQGIFTSQNGSAFSLIPGTDNNADFTGIIKLAVDKNNRLFAATYGGLYYSENGTTWTKIKSGIASDVCVGSDGTILAAVDNNVYLALAGDISTWTTLTTGAANALPNAGISWITFAIAPSDVNVMYTSLTGTDGNLLDVYCSTDKGATWSVIFPKNGYFEPYQGAGAYCNTMAVRPNDPYQLYLGGALMWHGVRINNTGYYNWENVSSGLYSPWVTYSAPVAHHSYMFNPANPTQIAVATDEGVSIGRILGDTIVFKTINKLMNTGEFVSVAFSAQPDYVMGGGPGLGVLAMGYFYPRPSLYPIGVNYPTSGFPIWYPEGLYSGTTGSTCEWSSIDSKVSVTANLGFSKNYIRRREMTDLSYENSFMIGNIRPVDSTGRVTMHLWESFNYAHSRDSVKVYARIKTIPADTTIWVESASNKFKFPYVTTAPLPKGDSLMVVDPIASRLFFAGFAHSPEVYGIYMTKDMLKFNVTPQYYRIHKDIFVSPQVPDLVTCISVSSDLNTLWAGTEKGRLIRVTGLINANDSSTACIDSAQCVLTDTVYFFPELTDRYISSISIDPRNSNNVLVTLGNYGNQKYVYYSQNGEASSPVFASIQGNLPAVPILCGLIEMHNNNAILGTDFGVYSTTNLGTGSVDWTIDQNNIGIDVPITEIRQQTLKDYHILNYGMIYLSSYGRGLWLDSTYLSTTGIAPVVGSPAANSTLKLNPNPVKDMLTFTCNHENSGNIEVSVFDLTGRKVLTTSYGSQAQGAFTATLNLSGLSQGTYIIKAGNEFGKIVKL